jgi:hypothetical protein
MFDDDSLGRAVSTVTGYEIDDRRFGVQFAAGEEIFFSIMCVSVLNPAQSVSNGYRTPHRPFGKLARGVKRNKN